VPKELWLQFTLGAPP